MRSVPNLTEKKEKFSFISYYTGSGGKEQEIRQTVEQRFIIEQDSFKVFFPQQNQSKILLKNWLHLF